MPRAAGQHTVAQQWLFMNQYGSISHQHMPAESQPWLSLIFLNMQASWPILCLPFFFFFKYLFIYLFMAVLGLRFCARAFSRCGKRGPLFIAASGPLTIAASLVAEHRLSLVAVSRGYSLLWCAGFSLQWLLLLRSTGSRRAGCSSCGTWAQ